MNDITALMATMKAAAEKAKHVGEAPVMDFYTRIDALNEFQLAACPANVLALVEALEKAQAENTAGVAGMAESYETIISMLRSRIAELEREKVALESVAQAMRDDMRESRTVTVTLAADSADSEVSSRNQPGMVVAVHIDAGDFVKFKGQVFEVEETDFDDHDVTLWFVCGEVLQCAAGCQLEVVAAPAAAGIQVIEGEQKNG